MTEPDTPSTRGWRAAMCVTTAPKPPPEDVARARDVAERLGVPYVGRRHSSIGRLRRHAGRELVYVVGREREEVRSPDAELHIHPGLFYLKEASGRLHPLLRSVAPADEALPGRMLDATLGVAGDALHVASALGVPVTGVEASPVLTCLLEEGLARLAADERRWSAGAALITVVHDRAVAHLGRQEAGAYDVVYLDPMFDRPLGAQPGFDVLRRLAVHEPVDDALWSEALRVAARRVVLKLPAMAQPPALPGGAVWTRRERGRACDFVIVDV